MYRTLAELAKKIIRYRNPKVFDATIFSPPPELEIFRNQRENCDQVLLTSLITEYVKKKYSFIRLFHGSRVPNPKTFAKEGLKLMSVENVTELVHPTWNFLAKSEIEEALYDTGRFSQGYGPRICCVADRKVLFEPGTNNFVTEGPECLRDIANQLGTNETTSMDLRRTLLDWVGVIVHLRIPIQKVDQITLRNVFNDISTNITYNDSHTILNTFNFFEKISPRWIEKIEKID